MGDISVTVTRYPSYLLDETPTMSFRSTPEYEVAHLDHMIDAHWQEMLEADARAEQFWAGVHEFWEGYDRGDAQPIEKSGHQASALMDIVQSTADLIEEMSQRVKEREAPPSPNYDYTRLMSDIIK